MLVAGSVLALLLAGLTVDGLIGSGSDDDTDNTPDNDAPDEASGTTTMSLQDLLFAEDDEADGSEDPSLQSRAESIGYTPLDDVDDQDTDDDGDDLLTDATAPEAIMPAGADSFGMLDITATTTLDDGTEVPFVASFEAQTDLLVMDFEGSAKEIPTITLDHGFDNEDVVVNANGVPVTVVQDAADLTEDNVVVVMDDTAGETPADGSLAIDLPIDPIGELPDTELPDIEPIVDVVETITDGVPGADVLDGIMDDLGNTLSDLGGATDMLDARADIDAAFGTGGTDALTGSFNNDMLTGGDGQDALFGDEGNDTLDGGDGNDELHGDFGDDNLQGGEGIDFLDGGEGNDALDGGADRDALFGGDGDDTLYGGSGDDVLHGGSGSDMLNGGSGNDTLNGTFSHGSTDQDAGDVLIGGSGDDSIVLGSGDVAQGGTGADTFVGGDHISDPNDAGVVSDFDPIEDRIEVLYNPSNNPNPVIEVQDFADGSGADIVLDGQVILSVSGAQGLDPSLIDLRATA